MDTDWFTFQARLDRVVDGDTVICSWTWGFGRKRRCACGRRASTPRRSMASTKTPTSTSVEPGTPTLRGPGLKRMPATRTGPSSSPPRRTPENTAGGRAESSANPPAVSSTRRSPTHSRPWRRSRGGEAATPRLIVVASRFSCTHGSFGTFSEPPHIVSAARLGGAGPHCRGLAAQLGRWD